MSTPRSVVVLIPVAGSPGWARPEKPHFRHHRADRARWAERQDIPRRPAIDRALLERMREIARRAVEDVRPQVEAVLAMARLVA